MLYLSVRDDRLRLRFTLEATPAPAEGSFEVTFVSETSARPVLVADAARSVEGEYRLEAELPPELATSWQALKVTDRMPFRCILRPTPNGG